MKKRKMRTLFMSALTVLCSVFVVNAGQKCEVLAAENVFEMTQGGSIRIAEPYGLRFQVKMSADVKNEAAKVGMLIFPADYLVNNGTDGDVYYESVEKLATTTSTNHRLDLDLTSKLYEEDGSWYGNGAIVNIKEKNMAREFVGIAYYEVDGITTWANTGEIAHTTRSASQVALNAHMDKTNAHSAETEKLLLKYIDYLKATDVEENASSRYQVRGYADNDGLRFRVVQFADNVVTTGDAWNKQTHLEAQIWQHNMGQGAEYGFSTDTYCAFWLDGSSRLNNYKNVDNVTNNVTISDRGEDYSEGYRYEICYEIFIEFKNNVDNPVDGPYAYVKFKHHMPKETTEGFEAAHQEYRDDSRYLWQDCCNSYEVRKTGIVEKDVNTVKSAAPTRYETYGYASTGGVYINAVQYVDNVISSGHEWDEQTHLEAEIWQHNIGYGMGGTYCAFFLDGTYSINDETNIESVRNDVTITDRGSSGSGIYRYRISYKIFIKFNNNLDNPADGPYAYVQLKHHMPGETTNGFENAYQEHRDNTRYLYQDYCDSYEFRATGIVGVMVNDDEEQAVLRFDFPEIKDSAVQSPDPDLYNYKMQATENGLYTYFVQKVPSVTLDNEDNWKNTHVEMQLWQADVGKGGSGSGTSIALFPDETVYIDSLENVRSVSLQVKTEQSENGMTVLKYYFWLEFDNRTMDYAKPYAYVKPYQFLPGVDTTGLNSQVVTRNGRELLTGDEVSFLVYETINKKMYN